jgi:hypothetical protein
VLTSGNKCDNILTQHVVKRKRMDFEN